MGTKDNKDIIDWNFIIISIIVMIATIIIFENSAYSNKLEMKDYFQFVASIGGAVLGAVVSFKILNISIINQREDFEAQKLIDENRWKTQREIEENRWETTVNQFNIQIKIQGINDKVNDFNMFLTSIIELIKVIDIFIDALYEYSENVSEFSKEVVNFRDENIYKNILQYTEREKLKKDKTESEIDVFNIENINNLYNQFIGVYEEVMIKSQCIREKNINDIYSIIKERINKSYMYYEKIINFKETCKTKDL